MLKATSVTAKGFKGLSFGQEFAEKTLIIGPNGSGKSSRALALILATRGYVPGVGKTNPDIVDAFCPGEEMSVGYSIGDTFLERVYTITKNGAVSQTFRVNGVRANKDFFQQRIGETGVLRPIDVGSFMALSDAQKLNALFNLYPPDGDVGSLTAEIEKSRERYLALEKRAKDAKASGATLLSSISDSEAPSGTLAETREEIRNREKDLEAARKELAEIEFQERERERREQEERENKKKEEIRSMEVAGTLPLDPPARGDDDVFDSVVTPPPGGTGGSIPWIDNEGTAVEEKQSHVQYIPIPENIGQSPLTPYGEVCAVLEKIIATIDRAGCNACAARLIAISELKKLKGVNNGR